MGREMETNGHVTATPVEVTTSVPGLTDLSRNGGAGDGLGTAWALWRRRRFVLAALAFFGFFSLLSTSVTFNVAIVAMTSGSGAHHRFSDANGSETNAFAENRSSVYGASADAVSEDALPVDATLNASMDAFDQEEGKGSAGGEFDWDSRTQGLLLSGFFYGYAASPLPAGWLVARAGGANLMGAGIAGSALLSLLTPIAARSGGAGLLLAVRVAQGMLQGCVIPSATQLLARWVPPTERSRLYAVIGLGVNIGNVITLPVSGLLATQWGWPSAFYCAGVLGVLWWLLWWIQIEDSPEIDKRVSPTERDYIKEKIGTVTICSKVISHPWRKILTSPPYLARVVAMFCADWAFYTVQTQIPMYLEANIYLKNTSPPYLANVAASFCANWAFYTVQTQMPMYLKDTLGYNLQGAGFVSALPFVAMGCFQLVAGSLADLLEGRNLLHTTTVRKLYVGGGFMMLVLCLLLSTYLTDPSSIVACITFGTAFIAFIYTASSVNILDMAPLHASVLAGLSNTIANLSGMLTPQITGFIVRTQSAAEWRVVFYVTSGVCLLGGAVYGLLGSGELQPWAEDGLEPPVSVGLVAVKAPRREDGGVDNPAACVS